MKLKISAFLLPFIFIACQSSDLEQYKNDNKALKSENQVLKKQLDSIRSSIPCLFAEALKAEESGFGKADSIYRKLALGDSLAFWTLAAQERILILKSDTSSSKLLLTRAFELAVNDTLEFVSSDNKCGEWGGDYERISIYLKSGSKPGAAIMLADYSKQVFDCDELEKSVPTSNLKSQIIERKAIPLKSTDDELITKCINSLVSKELKTVITSHAGTYAQVRLVGPNNDVTLYINNYSDNHWSEFHLFKRMLLSRTK